ncbi:MULTISPECIES: hypothetical protein [unclassified Isoptericola]|uniref:hypothetical protein n=1 Tax=unclassified Isoptericola TaxID=2623355 RepID=UPI00364FC6A5
MPWMRTGDSAATYPAVMATAGLHTADERTVNEVFGFVSRCAIQSAAHTTDYVIDVGTVQMIGGARWRDLISQCVAVGLLEVVLAGRTWRLVQDPEFIHLRLRAEVTWERQQRDDTRNPALKAPVLLRDGDNCRWCGLLVQWRGRKSNRTGTLDHLEPGTAGTVDTMVVACLGCNSARGGNVDLWDDNHTVRTPPTSPRYGKATTKYLNDNGHPEITENVSSDDGAAPQAAADPAPEGVRPAAPAAAAPARPTAVRAAAPPAARPKSAPKSPRNSTPKVDRTDSTGSGRDGSGTHHTSTGPRARPDLSPASTTEPTAQPPRPRRRRGRRGGARPRPTPGGTPA